jgi:hypothetical protein
MANEHSEVEMHRFIFSKFTFLIKGEGALHLPAYKGSTIRGGFGHAFRRIVCVFKDKECSDCLLREKCIYSWIFETPVPAEAEMMRKYTTAPHPFIIDLSMNDQLGDTEIRFGLILIGKAIDYLPYFIYAFEELGRIGIGKGRGKYKLIEVAQEPLLLDGESRRRVIYQGTNKMLDKTYEPLQWKDIISSPPQDEISISFLTPTRIKYNNRLCNDLEFHVLFRNLLRRISLLSYFHWEYRLDDSEFTTLIEMAKEVKIIKQFLHWKDWERYSNRQETRMKMGGFMGGYHLSGQI